MKLMTRLAVLFYVTVIMFVGVTAVLIALNWVDLNYILNVLVGMYINEELRLIGGSIGAGILLFNFLFANAISDRYAREKNIAFDNPSGRVSVSLTAMEDLVRKVVSKEPEVKEVRARITASKKGLDIMARLILKSDQNIPELTSRLQEIVKKKIQNTIGLEESIVVRVDVVKIIPEEPLAPMRKEKKKEDRIEDTERSVPFQGYRA